ncbi:cupin domain-containing protein [Paraburkholderia strydomiana]|uniref:cupin domain-containing protein n=1 Tax=Paraburkholderia strydomiana TaxID=1245417 RepID=UPI003338FFC4
MYVLSGEVTLYVGEENYLMRAGMCAGFRANGTPHHLKNNSTDDATIIEVGTRVSCDAVSYATDDLVAVMGLNGQWVFEHKNGEPY